MRIDAAGATGAGVTAEVVVVSGLVVDGGCSMTCGVLAFFSELARQISQPMTPRTATAITSISRTRLPSRSEEHTSELQSRQYLVCRLLLEKKKKYITTTT